MATSFKAKPPTDRGPRDPALEVTHSLHPCVCLSSLDPRIEKMGFDESTGNDESNPLRGE